MTENNLASSWSSGTRWAKFSLRATFWFAIDWTWIVCEIFNCKV